MNYIGNTFPHLNLAGNETLVQIREKSPAYITMFDVFVGIGNLAYIQFFDAAEAADITVGTTTPTYSFAVPTARDMDKGHPIRFEKGCFYAITNTPDGAGAPPAPCLVNINFT